MTVEIEFPIEFIVKGAPISLQTKRAGSRTAWKHQVRQASYSALPEGHFASEASITVTLFYFPVDEMEGDIDNIVKPILDALCRHIYLDDRQVQRVWVQKFEPRQGFPFVDPSPTLSDALKGQKPLVFIRLTNDPFEGLI
jgi:crossover junction endodeoxyribonuclease RusA